jgi:hypothetical protein
MRLATLIIIAILTFLNSAVGQKNLQLIKFRLLDSITHTPIDHSMISYYNISHADTARIYSDNSGQFQLPIQDKVPYFFYADRVGYIKTSST